MYNTNTYGSVPTFLQSEACENILKLAEGQWKKAVVKAKENSQELSVDKKMRKSDVDCITHKWLHALIWPCVRAINQQTGWNYEICAVEPMQVTRYEKEGFYGWHKDGRGDSIAAKSKNGLVRKLSMTLVLNTGYAGGDLRFGAVNNGQLKIDTPDLSKQGTMVVFPSDLEHSVSPVLQGTRFSLVAWFLGPAFR